MTKFTDNTRPKKCPWGSMRSVENVATGIWRVDASNGGGYYISPERRKAMPDELRMYVTQDEVHGNSPERSNWYEERAEWCLVCLAFPDDFTRRLGLAERPHVLQLAIEAGYKIRDKAIEKWLPEQQIRLK